jgi:hypothetical protein
VGERIPRQSPDDLSALAAQLHEAASLVMRLAEQARLEVEEAAPPDPSALPWQKEGRFRHLVEYVDDVLSSRTRPGAGFS